MLFQFSLTFWSFLGTVLVFPGKVSAVDRGERNPNRQCEFPAIDFDAQEIDVLGDRDKANICALPRPWSLCEKKGAADSTCKQIAQAVGAVAEVSCSHVHICKFRVQRPLLNPNTPGFAYVSLCVPDIAGVIFPCSDNDLSIVNPFYRVVIDETSGNNDDLPYKPVLGEEQCGQVDPSVSQFIYNPKKIIKPQMTERGQFPWQAAFYRKRLFQTDEYYDLFCGGSVISESHILTAAHCFVEKDFRIKVVLGDFVKNKDEDWEQEFPVYKENIFSHEEYDDNAYDFDIAIIKLRNTISYTKYVQPICLPSESLPYLEGYNCLISGWGNTEQKIREFPDNLQAASVPTISNDKCKNKDVYGDVFKGHMLCAGSLKRGGADTCQGDSGGPLICAIIDDEGNRNQIQLGVVSWGADGCGFKPGVYANLISLRQWIDETVERTNQLIPSTDRRLKPS